MILRRNLLGRYASIAYNTPKEMKNIVVISILLCILVGCSTDDAPTFFFEITPTDTVAEIPDHFIVGQPDTLQVTYRRPSTCHGFDGFEIDREDLVREIAIITKVVEGRSTCTDLENDLRTAPLIIIPEEIGEIILRFFAGNDQNGNPTFMTFNVPIIE